MRAILSVLVQSREESAKRTRDQSNQRGRNAPQIMDARSVKNIGHLLPFPPRLMYRNKGSVQSHDASHRA